MYKKIVLLITFLSLLVVMALGAGIAHSFAVNLRDVSGIQLSGFSNLNGLSVTSTEVSAATNQNTVAATPARFYSMIPVNDIAALAGHEANPQDFVAHYQNGSNVEAQILYPPEIDWHNLGRQEVVVNVVENGVSAREIAAIYILEPVSSIQVEAGSSIEELNPLDFINDSQTLDEWVYFNIAFTGDLEYLTAEVGTQEVSLIFNDVAFSVQVDIVDTTPPVVTLTDVTVRLGREVSPWDFIVEAIDISEPIIAVFTSTVDVNREGQHLVNIVVSDYFGNAANHAAMLTVLPNTEPPTIIGAQDIEVMIGTSAMFRQGVTAQDAFGTPLHVYVDSSLVNVHELGIFPVTYSAVDVGGLRAELTVNVYVIDVDTHEVRELAQAILDAILHEGMTQVEESRAIFNWVSANVGYAAGFEPRSVYEGARQALVQRRGDCFTLQAVSEVMLTMAGVPNRRVDRYDGSETRHAWNLINPDGLGWHHFDTTPIRGVNIDRFMFTQSQALQFSQYIRETHGNRNYFGFDTALHPQVVY